MYLDTADGKGKSGYRTPHGRSLEKDSDQARNVNRKCRTKGTGIRDLQREEQGGEEERKKRQVRLHRQSGKRSTVSSREGRHKNIV